jgi:hypothetical protein
MLSPAPTVEPCRRIEPRPEWQSCIVAATGPSLTPEVAQACRGRTVLAVNDAYQLFPFAAALYACDAAWWIKHRGCPEFSGEKWTCSEVADPRILRRGNKVLLAGQYGLKLVAGANGHRFSAGPELIHYGANSGFQAVNLALLFGARRIVLVGFDMRAIGGRRHFFGDHPPGLVNSSNYDRFIKAFDVAAVGLPDGVEILNATPGSALSCFPRIDLDQALAIGD